MKTKKTTKIHKSALIFGTLIFFSILLVGIGSYRLFLTSYKGKIYPFVRIASVKVGGMKIDSAYSKLKTNYQNNTALTFTDANNNQKTLSLTELGISYNLEDALTRAYRVGRGSSLQKDVPLALNIDFKKFQKVLEQNYASTETESSDAKYQISQKGELSITPSVIGSTMNIAAIAKQIDDILIQNLPPQPITISTKKFNPLISDAVLEDLKPKAQKIIDFSPKITVNNKTYSASFDQKLKFIDVSIVDGVATISISKDGVKEFTDDLAQKVYVAPKPELVYDNGEVSAEGADGFTLDSDKTIETLTDSFTNLSETVIPLTLVTVTKSKKTVDRPFTPGLYEGKYIEVDLSSQMLYQMEGVNKVGEHRVSTGKWSMPTPVGTYTINSKNPRAYSSTYDLYMPYWMAFIGSKYGLHELPEWANGTKEGESHLGKPVSHGCIRLGVGDAQQVYEWADIGTIVYIHK